MGQQQLLLVILGVIIVGVAIAIGLTQFSAQGIQSNKDAIINDLNSISAHCYQYKIRATSMRGGQGSYSGYSIPAKMAVNENGSYSISSATATSVTIVGTSSGSSTNTITVLLNNEGRLQSWTYSGDFQ